jgi:uncharacterized protein
MSAIKNHTRLVDLYIDALNENEKRIVEKLRVMLFELVPGLEERFSFKLPFYHYYGMFCYINKVKEGIEFNFCRGKDLEMAFPELERKNRAIIAGITICNYKQMNIQILKELILAAAEWNETCKKNNTPIVKKKKPPL